MRQRRPGSACYRARSQVLNPTLTYTYGETITTNCLAVIVVTRGDGAARDRKHRVEFTYDTEKKKDK